MRTVKTLVLFVFIINFGWLKAAYSQDNVILLIPDWLTANSRQAVDRLALRLSSEHLTSTVKQIVLGRTTPDSIIRETEQALNEADVVVWIGYSENFAKGIISSNTDTFLNWNGLSNQISADLNPSDGMIALGAGWLAGSRQNGITISVPKGRATSLPIISATLVRSRHRDSSRSAELMRSVFDTLQNSLEGQRLMEQTTIVPAIGNNAIRIKIRPERDNDDDECDDCEDEGSSSQSCDPDGYIVTAFDQLQLSNGRAIMPGFASNIEDDGGDGCDECQESRSYEFKAFLVSQQYRDISNRMKQSQNLNSWQKHFEDLALSFQSGKTVVVLTCDPD